jgi:hypothetical protein
MFQMPAVILSIVIATLVAVIIFIWQGRGLRQWVVIWIAGLAGFFIAQWITTVLGWNFLRIGQVHPFEGILVALGACFGASQIMRRP